MQGAGCRVHRWLDSLASLAPWTLLYRLAVLLLIALFEDFLFQCFGSNSSMNISAEVAVAPPHSAWLRSPQPARPPGKCTEVRPCISSRAGRVAYGELLKLTHKTLGLWLMWSLQPLSWASDSSVREMMSPGQLSVKPPSASPSRHRSTPAATRVSRSALSSSAVRATPHA